MRRLRVRDSWMEYREVLADLEDFRATANFWGERRTMGVPSDRIGWLYPHRDEWGALLERAEYVVWSFRTPIAFAMKPWPHTDDLIWFIPNVRYSQTTTRHQNKIRVAVGDYMDREMASPAAPYTWVSQDTDLIPSYRFTYHGTMLIHVDPRSHRGRMDHIEVYRSGEPAPVLTYAQFKDTCVRYRQAQSASVVSSQMAESSPNYGV